jgi:hypothetical protein
MKMPETYLKYNLIREQKAEESSAFLLRFVYNKGKLSYVGVIYA